MLHRECITDKDRDYGSTVRWFNAFLRFTMISCILQNPKDYQTLVQETYIHFCSGSSLRPSINTLRGRPTAHRTATATAAAQ
jgi:hypothetical protein